MDKIIEATYNYCVETVNQVNRTYNEMKTKINYEPTNEKELVETREFINQAPKKVDEITELLKVVYKHYLLLEEFSFTYKETDIEQYWYMKIWPLKIQAYVTDGKNTVGEKSEIFSQKLE
jgi:hypothetical protein